MGDVWLKQGDHFAVKRYDEREDVGILYLPEGSQLVASGDLIVQGGDGLFRIGARTEEGARAEPNGERDLCGITPECICDAAAEDEVRERSLSPAVPRVGDEEAVDAPDTLVENCGR